MRPNAHGAARRPSLVVELRGGLGNQLFQYFFGRAIAETHCMELALGCWCFPSGHVGYEQQYELDQIVSSEGGRVEPVARLVGLNITPMAKSAIRFGLRLGAALPERVISDTTVQSWSDLSPQTFRRSTVARGYWQDVRWWPKGIDWVRESVDATLPPHLQQFTNKFALDRAVVVGVRRGDYVDVPSVSSRHGFVGMPYLMKALSLAQSKAHTRFDDVIVITNDEAWVHSVFARAVPDKHVHVVANTSSLNKFLIFSHFRHAILSNSTLDWWGALMRSCPGVTVAPEMWFRDAPVPLGLRVPDWTWIR